MSFDLKRMDHAGWQCIALWLIWWPIEMKFTVGAHLFSVKHFSLLNAGKWNRNQIHGFSRWINLPLIGIVKYLLTNMFEPIFNGIEQNVSKKIEIDLCSDCRYLQFPLSLTSFAKWIQFTNVNRTFCRRPKIAHQQVVNNIFAFDTNLWHHVTVYKVLQKRISESNERNRIKLNLPKTGDWSCCVLLFPNIWSIL